jgi:hypothetical protein
MKFFTGCVAAATLALAATAAQAQVPAGGISGGAMIVVSDFDGPYGPPDAAPPPPRYGYGYEERGPAPALLPATEVYTVLRARTASRRSASRACAAPSIPSR